MIAIISGTPTEEQFEFMNQESKKYCDNVKQIALDELENDIQKQVFLDWWNGKSLWMWNAEKQYHDIADQYKDINKKDWDKANGYILWACGQGCG